MKTNKHVKLPVHQPAVLDRRTFIRRSSAVVMGGIIASTLPVRGMNKKKKRPRNVLVLMSDQHGPDDIGVFGNRNALTPTLDSLASSGYSLRQSYCQSPVCVASRNSVLNGCYPHSNGVISNAFSGNTTLLSFPQVLRQNGYITACFGKLHTPGREMLDWDVCIEDKVRPVADLAHNGIVLSGTANLTRDPTIGAPDPYPKTTTFEWLAKENTIRFMRQHRDRPWLIQCSMYKPHPPFQPPREYWDRIDRSKLEIPAFPENDLDDGDPRYVRLMKNRGMWNMPVEQILNGMQGYYGNIAFVDDMFREVLNVLEHLNLQENTLIIYLADHGEMLHRHGLWTKFVFFDASVRVPLILSLPGIIDTGIESRALVELVDLFPTIMELTGCETPATVQGKSLVPLLQGKTKHHRNTVHCEYPLTGKNTPGGAYHATMMLFDGRYKLIDNGPEVSPELYDHANDPGEFRNVAADPEQQQRVGAMLAEVRSWHSHDAVPVQPRVRDVRQEG